MYVWLRCAAGDNDRSLPEPDRLLTRWDARQVERLRHDGGDGTPRRWTRAPQRHLDAGRIQLHALDDDVIPSARPRPQRGDDDHLATEIHRRQRRTREEGLVDSLPELSPQCRISNDGA